MEQVANLSNLANDLGLLLKSRQKRLVLAESCTGGLLAASLTLIPGISESFCGSAVTYRDGTKSAWIRVPESHLADPQITAVSAIVADDMCQGLLERTPEADLAASVTGHLGPGAPPELDGIVFIGILSRGAGPAVVQRRITSDTPPTGFTLREHRRLEAAQLVLQSLIDHLRLP